MPSLLAACSSLIFAMNSAVHCYLVLAYTDDEKVALNVGFYYMAIWRATSGNLLSGLIYPTWGIVGCLWVSMVFVLCAGLISLKLEDSKWQQPYPSLAMGDGESLQHFPRSATTE